MIHHPITNDGVKTDFRYSIAKEYCGHVKPHFVARFCGEFIGQSSSYPAAVLMAVGYKNKRNGALTITEITN